MKRGDDKMSASTIREGAIKMADSPSKRRWDKENTFKVTVKFQRKTDQDCIDFLEGKNKRDAICETIREYIKNHQDE